jgi:formylglycine-generating enzyme required for sulfatase activity
LSRQPYFFGVAPVSGFRNRLFHYMERGVEFSARLIEMNNNLTGSTEAKPGTIRHPADGKEMVYIPAGTYEQGSEAGYSEEAPTHAESVPGFYMDKYPVTNAEYAAFVRAAGAAPPENPDWDNYPEYFTNYPDYPVVNVTWPMAVAYAEWAGKRLPTETEWEYAALGGGKGPYPWGEGLDGARANYADKSSEYYWRDFSQNDGYAYTSPVGNYPPNGYGLYDMAGNVWEWCSDWFFRYDDHVHDETPFSDGWGGSRVCRGGCYHSNAYDLRVARRRCVLGGGIQQSVGFRCVADSCDAPRTNPNPIIEEDLSWRAKIDAMDIKIPDNMELCVGMSPELEDEDLSRLKKLGATSIEQYVTWQTVEDAGRDEWDFTLWDKSVAQMKNAGLKWVPFLIMGPAYALPKWYRESPDFEGLYCLEHNMPSKINSIWDENFHYYIDRFIARFAAEYRDSGIIEALLLGITGDFGEAIFPDWHGNWCTQIPNLYHSHAGYWCNDRFARKHYVKYMAAKYKDINVLNAAWGANYPAFSAIGFPVPVTGGQENFRIDEHTQAAKFDLSTPEKRRFFTDFTDWYRRSMEEYASFWMGCVRKHFPDTPIYLCTGGNAAAWHAADFAAQSKLAAAAGGGVRITNEASNYPLNFSVTNWVSSACRHYGAYASFEPAGMVTERGVVCRIYNVTAAGIIGLHMYVSNFYGSEDRLDAYTENIKYLFTGKNQKDVAMFYPDDSIIMKMCAGQTETVDSGSIMQVSALPQVIFNSLRDFTDYIYADNLTVSDGILDGAKALIIPWGGYYRRETILALEAYVEKGGLLAAIAVDKMEALEDGINYIGNLFDVTGGVKAIGRGKTLYLGAAGAVAELTGNAVPDNIKIAADIFDPLYEFLTGGGAYIPDGRLDGVYTSVIDDCALLLNNSGEDKTAVIRARNGDKMEIPLPANTIVKHGI